MGHLFEPTRIGNLELKNRFVRSATYDGHADRYCHVSEKQIAFFSELADGGVGLIVTGAAFVHDSGRLGSLQNSVASDDVIPGFRRLNAAVHGRGAKIALQLFHAGRHAAHFLTTINEKALAPSVVSDDPHFSGEHRFLTQDEIWKLVRAFGDGAARAREAGFDAVQLHAAHDFLPSQFLSPYTNRRGDEWGGALENRLRFHYEVYRDIKAKVGEDYPILIKVGVQDAFAGGLGFGEGELAAQILSQWGFAALEISQGLRGAWYEGTEFRTNINSIDREAYFRDWCREIKSKVNVPVMMVGGLRTFELMAQVIREGETDFVSLCRPLIREPNIIKRWKSGDRHKATCVSCNKCLEETVAKGKPLQCIQGKSK